MYFIFASDLVFLQGLEVIFKVSAFLSKFNANLVSPKISRRRVEHTFACFVFLALIWDSIVGSIVVNLVPTLHTTLQVDKQLHFLTQVRVYIYRPAACIPRTNILGTHLLTSEGWKAERLVVHNSYRSWIWKVTKVTLQGLENRPLNVYAAPLLL